MGAGTGKFLPLLLGCGGEILAVEPAAAMREQLTAAFPQVEALAGTAEAVPLPDVLVDAVVCPEARSCASEVAWSASRPCGCRLAARRSVAD
ncbi:class I SAM-dependent methyltransferase [Phenylobacterium sp.]|uniref:class I SAM-dependent methyltransferase n=1 Tax=Phenylobacterium sp. TaxID=1871053 RepID=UPI0035B2CC70